MGIRELAAERGAAVVGEQADRDEVVRVAARLQPDVVVLPLDGVDSRLVAARVRTAAPAARVVLWGRDERVIETQDQCSAIRRRIVSRAAEALMGELGRQSRRSPIQGARCPVT
ncbi:MAG TPA: hypothetical protein VD931_14645 [Baekduia sp.]|nr:hypothetical protein [Baekduia sp.]